MPPRTPASTHLPPQYLTLFRFSLVAVWLGTALVSLIEWQGQSEQLLVASGIASANLRHLLIGAGAALDLVLGLALWRWPGRRTYLAALWAMAGMTVVATCLQPALWLHPLGPLLKNLPIATMLWAMLPAQAQPSHAE